MHSQTSPTGNSCGSSRSDSSAFVNWDRKTVESDKEKTTILFSLVSMVRKGESLEGPLEGNAELFLNQLLPSPPGTVSQFLVDLESSSNESVIDYMEALVVLLSLPNQRIIKSSLEILKTMIRFMSAPTRLRLVTANLIPQIITNLSPLSLPFTESQMILCHLRNIIGSFVSLASMDCVAELKVSDRAEQQAVHEAVLKQVLVASEEYFWHLFRNRFSIDDPLLTNELMFDEPRLLSVAPYFQPTLDYVLTLPIFQLIPSCLTFFDHDHSIFEFFVSMADAVEEWNTQDRTIIRSSAILLGSLRKEGFEDVVETRRHNFENGFRGRLMFRHLSSPIKIGKTGIN
ncbi:hypothetical protein BLNAU_3099 [Blattamonas nauphoetae]|uniref:Uncharacterized protein n=1 Tax=Blattamonas nauphoetae TaxID=2049346 RepID=A0ABQ9YE40_9EUKA|nr:hypothetical protein BLNAU_3099 [Blattamonas nauphoetae]